MTLPEAAERRGALTEGMATALMAAGVDSVKQGQIMTFANAIYASRARNLDPKSQEAVGIMRDAVQAALGQKTDKRGALTGGIQEVGGNDVLLPVGVAGIALDAALDKAFTGGPKPEQSFLESLDVWVPTFRSTTPRCGPRPTRNRPPCWAASRWTTAPSATGTFGSSP